MAKKILFSVVLFLLTLEVLLRISAVYQTADERDAGSYTYRYRTSEPTWYHTWGANSTIDYINPEFTYINRYNSLGNREGNVDSFFTDTSSYKIICIGDSFTEGDGAPSDSTWVKRLEQLARRKFNPKIKIYNAGVCGSDVVFNNRMLADKLLKLGPDMVIECLNYSDVYDIIYRGGTERFNADSTTSCKVGPVWEKLYANLHVFRPFSEYVLGYNKYLVKKKTSDKEEWDALNMIREQVERTAALCRQKNIRYLLVIHPHTGELTAKLKTSKVQQMFGNKPYVVSLFPAMNRFYTQHDMLDYSWKMNGHFNSRGYQAMGDMIFDEMNRKKITF